MGSHSRGDAARQVSDIAEGEDPSLGLLARTIQQEIIPRLMLVHSRLASNATVLNPVAEPVDAHEVEAFARLLLLESEYPAFAALEARCQLGPTLESVYLGLLAPVARLLGEYWTDDVCDFTDVTLALGRLHRMLNHLSQAMGRQTQPKDSGMSILLAPAPREQHTLGLAMVGDIFRRAGWEVCGGPKATAADAAMLASKRKFDAIGFSLACDSHLDALGQAILSLRRATGATPLCIIVGGPVFALHPEYVTRVHADLVAGNGCEAPELVRQFVAASRISA